MGSPPLATLQLPPHAATVLHASLPPAGAPSHAYLFHGPPGAGKRAAARAFAAGLLADGAADPDSAAQRAGRGVHPDLAWVRPSGAAEMLVSDIDQAVVAAASRTPFEARRRVFVVEGADVLGERAANKLLKTLEEPADHVCLLLLATRAADVLPTIVSRCQLVRFDAPPPSLIAARLREELATAALLAQSPSDAAARGDPPSRGAVDAAAPHDPPSRDAAPRGDPPSRGAVDAAAPHDPPSRDAAPRADPPSREAVDAVARLCLGDQLLARRLLHHEGAALRASVERFARELLSSAQLATRRPWSDLLDAARRAGDSAGQRTAAELGEELELLAASERRRHEREATEAARRAARRERTRALELSLRLLELWLRDALCLSEGVREAIHAVDSLDGLAAAASGRAPHALRRALELVSETRLRLAQNVSEELALEALAYRLRAALTT
ncbi:MAG: hypothetical protein ACYCUM_06205 [Solirubrobacteraceae bacterium]